MATNLNDAATLKIGSGHFYRAAVDTAPPTNLATLTGWDEIGHTSLEDILAFSSDGGDATTLGTLQKPVLKTAYSPRTESFTFNLAQFDMESLKLYFGSNMASIDGGTSEWLGVPLTPAPTNSAFLLVLTDGVVSIGLYAPKAELYRADDMSFSDTESLQSLPIQVKPVASGSNTYAYAWLPLA